MIEIPEDGDRVRVVGAWVSDEGGMEVGMRYIQHGR